MFDILKKRQSKRTLCSNSYEMLFTKGKSKSLLRSLSRMFKKKKKIDRVKEASDDMSRRKQNGDCAMLTSLERSDSGMRCSLTTVCDSLQAAENLDSMGVNVETVRKKQHEKSCADNDRVKELEDCGRTMMFTNQDDLQQHVHVIIDSGICKITVYSDGSYETEVSSRVVEKNETFSKMSECSKFQPETCEAEKKRKDMPKTFQPNICRPETGQDEYEICNQKPTAVVLPTRHQTDTIYVELPYPIVERNTVELAQRNVTNTDDNTVVKTDEDGHVRTVNSSSNMEPDNDNTFVKDIDDWSSNISSLSIDNNNINVRSLQERDNGSFVELNLSSIASVISAEQEMVPETAGQETVQETGQGTMQETAGTETVRDVRTFTRYDSYSEDQKSRNENTKEAVTGIHMFCQTDAHSQFNHIVHSDKTLYDVPDSCITNKTVEKLVQKVDHIESKISKLSRLFTVMFNSRIPGIMQKQDVISECKENCKASLNENDMDSSIERNLLHVPSLLSNSFNLSECQEYDGYSSFCEEMNIISSFSNNKGEAVKTGKIQKAEKDSKRGEPANQPTAMLLVERPMRELGAESDEIGHTVSMLGEGSLNHNMDLKESMEGQAEQSSLVVDLNKIKSSEGEGNDSCFKNIDEIYDGVKQGPDLLQLKDREEKDQNHNEDKSRCVSEVRLTRSIIIGHTNKTPMENTENDAQLEMTSDSTTSEYARTVDSSGYSEKDNTDIGQIPIMDDVPSFINSGSAVLCESVTDQVNLETDETAVSTSKLNSEASDSCSNADYNHESCLDQMENVVGVSNCVLNVNSHASHASDASNLHLVDSNVSTINTDHCASFPDADPVISDKEYIPDHGIPAHHDRQRQASVDYSSHHCLQQQDKSKEECTRESNCIWDSDSEKPRANKFVSMYKVQEEKLKETSPIVNKKKLQRSFKSGVFISCRLCSLQRKRRGRKRKVKLKKNMELSRKVRHAEKCPGILSDLKILLHCLTSSFAQNTVKSGTLTQTTKIIQEKTDFAAELGILVSEKYNSSQENLIDDFLRSLVSTWFIFPTIKNGLQSVILLPTGLQLYFERLLRGAPPEERERMSYEWLRLQTFINYPSSAPGSGIRLARAGFYYSGNGTVTVCYACGGQYSGWNFHDDPYEIHRRISPDCPFLRGNPTYPNVPIMQEGEQNGIQMGSNTSNAPLSQAMVSLPSSLNRLSEMSLPAAFQPQNLTITQQHSSAVVLPSIHNSQEGGSEQQASQQSMSVDEHHLRIGPSSINPASSAHIDEIPSAIHQPVTSSVAVAPSTSVESLQRQQPTTAASSVSQPQQPTDDAENTQYRNPGNFVLIKPAGQVEDPGVDPTPQTMSERPKHPEYAPLSSRVNSYTGWPTRLDQTPQQMAEAGFYYAGINDYTRCFQCGGGLRNWEPGDNPWIEHARWYPQCAYVLGKRGQRFVNAVLKKQAELLAAQNTERNNTNTSTINNTTNTSSLAVSKTGTQEPVTQPVQPRYFQNPNENEIAIRLINELGYQRERVREAILEVKRSRGQKEIAVEHVIELLIADEERRARAGRQNADTTVEELIQESGRLTLHDDSIPPPAVPPPTSKATATTTQPSPLNHVAGNRSNGQQQNGQKSLQTNQTSAPGRAPSVPQSQRNMSGPMSLAVDVPSSSSVFSNREGSQNIKSTASNRPSSPPLMEPTSLPAFDADSLREEYMRLKDQNLCKICMERNVELAFLPCGHLVCCEICGQTLRFCPICRAKIQASVKTYLS